MEACAEVRVLRQFSDAHAKARAVNRLCRRYRRGWRSARQVVLGLDALKAQNEHQLASELVAGALAAVVPVPTVLWTWACRHADTLGVHCLRHVLRLAGTDARYDKHLARHTHRFAKSPDGLVALVHEFHRLPWVPGVAQPAVAALLTPA